MFTGKRLNKQAVPAELKFYSVPTDKGFLWAFHVLNVQRSGSDCKRSVVSPAPLSLSPSRRALQLKRADTVWVMPAVTPNIPLGPALGDLYQHLICWPSFPSQQKLVPLRWQNKQTNANPAKAAAFCVSGSFQPLSLSFSFLF